MEQVLRNAQVYTEACEFVKADISLEGEYIRRIAQAAQTTEDGGKELDCSGLFAVPGLIDLHIHGCGGAGFYSQDPDSLDRMASHLISEGITSFLPATITLDEAALLTICGQAGAHKNKPLTSELLGVYLEGPFIAPSKRGAQNREHIRKPDRELFRRLNEQAAGKIRIAALAPELEGALEFIDAVSKEGVICSLAHTEADYKTAVEAFRRGARLVTHLFNGMAPFHHRQPGIAGALFDQPGSGVNSAPCFAELICDGNFVCPTMIRAAFQLLGDSRIIMISDNIGAEGQGDGSYAIAGIPYTVRNGIARMEDGALLGPVISLRECLKRMVKEFGLPLEGALKTVTLNPARLLGMENRIGVLKPGNYADIVLLNQDLDVQMVIKKGRRLG